ncbi:MAG: isoamylase early set domain-containing protein [Gemmatimonadota bacterium]|nr:MAG: isoamylase early set domain-containing protein [Gemmatimonadota bacterium]
MSDSDNGLKQVIDLLKQPVSLDSSFDEKVMEQVESVPPPRAWARSLWTAANWMRRGRTLTVSPLQGLALAAGVVAALFVGRMWVKPDSAVSPGPTAAVAEAALVHFVIVAPGAGSVSLVGDFNDWAALETPMHRVEGNGVWSVSIPLTTGRYRYAFLVDGTTWLSDPSAPPALDDEFGRPGSVLTVGEL